MSIQIHIRISAIIKIFVYYIKYPFLSILLIKQLIQKY